MRETIRIVVLCAIVAMSVAACGGGGGSSSDDAVSGVNNDVDNNDVNSSDSTPQVPNQPAGINVSPVNGLETTETGGLATFSMVLASVPSADVSIALSSSDNSEGNVSPASVTFTPNNWDQAQTITVSGVDDGAVDGNITYSIVTANAQSADSNYNEFEVADVTVINVDNDQVPNNEVPVAIVVNPTSGLSTNELTQTASFAVVLSQAPSAAVTLGLRSSDLSEGIVDVNALTFSTENLSLIHI